MLQGLVKKTASCQYHKGESLKGIAAFFKGRYDMGRKKTIRLITLNVMFVIFSLASAFTGTYAWFNAMRSFDTSVGQFSVATTGDAKFRSAQLIKFNYLSRTFGTGESAMTIIDYLNPGLGSVASYPYNNEKNQFEDESHNKIDVMNTYDPVDYLINGGDLASMNCNAIYRFEMESSSFLDCFLNSSLVKIDGVDFDEENEILLSTCLDFDLFFEEDLNDDNPLFVVQDNPKTASTNEYDEKGYYPSYKTTDNGKYYKYNASTSSWDQTTTPPSGTDKRSVLYEEYLPLPPSSGDYFFVEKEATEFGEYFQWSESLSTWQESPTRPESGANKGNLYFSCDLPSSGNRYL